MQAIAEEPSEVAVWKRAIDPEAGEFCSAAAEALLALRLSPHDLDRADSLAAKARLGKLTSQETRELDSYLSVGSALDFLKSKARRSLRQPAA
ncbi:MAG: hypothetical protein ABMA26_06075 [Limisphaerales bacterium]